MPRRGFLALAGTAMMAPLGFPWSSVTATEKASTMYGLIGKMTAVAGQRCSRVDSRGYDLGKAGVG